MLRRSRCCRYVPLIHSLDVCVCTRGLQNSITFALLARAQAAHTPPPHTHTRTHIVVLQDLHVQLRSKNDMMKAMKRQIKKLNGTLPKMLEEQPDDDDWAW